VSGEALLFLFLSNDEQICCEKSSIILYFLQRRVEVRNKSILNWMVDGMKERNLSKVIRTTKKIKLKVLVKKITKEIYLNLFDAITNRRQKGVRKAETRWKEKLAKKRQVKRKTTQKQPKPIISKHCWQWKIRGRHKIWKTVNTESIFNILLVGKQIWREGSGKW
jgi:hypothetical protein